MRRTRLKPMSAKKRQSATQYRKVRRWVQDRSNGLCEAQTAGVCTGRGEHAHHILRRSQGGPDEPGNLLWLCAPCHEHAHRNPAWAYEHGLLRKAGTP